MRTSLLRSRQLRGSGACHRLLFMHLADDTARLADCIGDRNLQCRSTDTVTACCYHIMQCQQPCVTSYVLTRSGQSQV